MGLLIPALGRKGQNLCELSPSSLHTEFYASQSYVRGGGSPLNSYLILQKSFVSKRMPGVKVSRHSPNS